MPSALVGSDPCGGVCPKGERSPGNGPVLSDTHAQAQPPFATKGSTLPGDERLRRLKESLSVLTSQYERDLLRLFEYHWDDAHIEVPLDAVPRAAWGPSPKIDNVLAATDDQPCFDAPADFELEPPPTQVQLQCASEPVCQPLFFSAKGPLLRLGESVGVESSSEFDVSALGTDIRQAPGETPKAQATLQEPLVAASGQANPTSKVAHLIPSSGSDGQSPHVSKTLLKDPLSRRTTTVQRAQAGVKVKHVSNKSKKRMEHAMRWSQRVVISKHYEIVVMAIVTLNALFIGIQVQDYALRSAWSAGSVNDGPATWEKVAEGIFLLVFTLELTGRMHAYRKAFFTSHEWTWNVFDLFVVSVMWIDVLFSELAVAGSALHDHPMISHMSILRILRVMRIVRVLRVIRVMNSFRELRLMLSSILQSMLSLFWALVSMTSILYIFGVSLTQGAVDFLNEGHAWRKTEHESLRHHFGRLDFTVLALYEGMTGGISWGELYDELQPLSWNYQVLFLMFISMSVLAVLNIVTGVFVQSAMDRSQQDSETLIQDALNSKKEYLAKIQMVFMELDINQSGTLTYSEFAEVVTDERMAAYFEALGLDLEELDTLFVLLDRDQQGAIDMEEFLAGCLRLKGEARGIDMAIVQFESRWLMHNVGIIVEKLSGRDAAWGADPTATSFALKTANSRALSLPHGLSMRLGRAGSLRAAAGR